MVEDCYQEIILLQTEHHLFYVKILMSESKIHCFKNFSSLLVKMVTGPLVGLLNLTPIRYWSVCRGMLYFFCSFGFRCAVVYGCGSILKRFFVALFAIFKIFLFISYQKYNLQKNISCRYLYNFKFIQIISVKHIFQIYWKKAKNTYIRWQ